MTGVQLDLFTVILMVILAFICGYSSGHKLGRYEVRKSITDIIGGLNKALSSDKTKTDSTDPFLKFMRQTEEKKGDNDIK